MNCLDQGWQRLCQAAADRSNVDTANIPVPVRVERRALAAWKRIRALEELSIPAAFRPELASERSNASRARLAAAETL